MAHGRCATKHGGFRCLGEDGAVSWFKKPTIELQGCSTLSYCAKIAMNNDFLPS